MGNFVWVAMDLNPTTPGCTCYVQRYSTIHPTLSCQKKLNWNRDDFFFEIGEIANFCIVLAFQDG